MKKENKMDFILSLPSPCPAPLPSLIFGMTESWSVLCPFRHLGSAFPCPPPPPPPPPPVRTALLAHSTPLSSSLLFLRAFEIQLSKNAAFWINESFFARCRWVGAGAKGEREMGLINTEWRARERDTSATNPLPPSFIQMLADPAAPLTQHTHTRTHAFAFLTPPSTPPSALDERPGSFLYL